jgi:CRP/FNR family cyclic AMP-dependent transcriptional regulator
MFLGIEKVLILKKVELFSHLSENQLIEVAGSIKEIEAIQGEQFITKGEEGDCLYIVVDGKVRLHDGDKEIQVLDKYQIVGEMAVLDSAPRWASATALEDTLLFKLDGEALYELMEENVDIVKAVIKNLCTRIRKTV